MQRIKDLNDEITFYNSFDSLLKTYEEIAILKMRRNRASVINARKFMDDLYPLFEKVREIYGQKISLATQQESIDEDFEMVSFSTISRNNKDLDIILTPNDRLVGDIASKTCAKFFEKHNKNNDILVIGKLGKKIISSSGLSGRFFYVDLPEHSDEEEFYKIIDYVSNYSGIRIFYSKFISFISQESVGDYLLDKDVITGSSMKGEDLDEYIFEPDIDQVLNFFEIEIFFSLFKLKVFETELAKLGSRVNAMERASASIETESKKTLNRRLVLEKNLSNQKQLEKLSGFALWGVQSY